LYAPQGVTPKPECADEARPGTAHANSAKGGLWPDLRLARSMGTVPHPSQTHSLPILEGLTLAKAFGGGEATHFNPACAEMIDRIVEPVVGEEVIDVHREVNCEGSRLDLLAVTNERRVAVELQYGDADASHLGRLVGWYGPSVGATDMVLVAEGFPALLIDAVRNDRLRDLALVQASAGWNQGGEMGVAFSIAASSVVPESGSSEAEAAKNAAHCESVRLLGDALATHHLKDSDAKYYIRLFPIKDHCWAVVRVRSSRVVVNVGSSAKVDPEAVVDDLDEDWVAKPRSGLFLTVSREAESYSVNPDAVEAIAQSIANLESSIHRAVDCLIATVEADELDET